MATPGGPLSSLIQTGTDGVEPGTGTTEFWVSAASMILAAVDAFGFHHLTQAQDAAILALVPVAYAIARSIRKGLAK